MKRFAYSKALIAVTMGAMLTGCAQEELGYKEGDTTVNFTAQLPAALSTRATATGLGTAAEYVHVRVYEQGVDKTAPVYTTQAERKGQAEVTIPLKLANGATYDIVFWCDAFSEDDTENKSPYSFENGNLKVDYDLMTVNSDNVDAFYGIARDFKAAPETDTQKVTLTRPFAQLNLGTDDLEHPTVTHHYGRTNLNTSVEVLTYNNFDLRAGKAVVTAAADTATLKFRGDARALTAAHDYPVTPETYKYTNMAYVLVPSSDVTTVYFKTYDDATTENTVHSAAVTQVPLKSNYRTNIYGSLLTSTTGFKVTVDAMFGEPANNMQLVATAAELKQALNSTEAEVAVQLKSDITTTEPIVLENKRTDSQPQTFVIDTNGHKAPEVTLGNNVQVVVKGGELTVNGVAQAPAAAPRRAAAEEAVATVGTLVVAETGATVNIKSGGFFTTDLETPIVKSNGGKINVLGGTFGNKEEASVVFAADKASDIVVTGGFFYNYDPCNANGLNDGSLSFVPSGKCSYKSAGQNYWRVLTAKDGMTQVNTALANSIELTLNDDAVYPTATAIAKAVEKTVNGATQAVNATINLNGHKIQNLTIVNRNAASVLTINGHGEIRPLENHTVADRSCIQAIAGKVYINGGSFFGPAHADSKFPNLGTSAIYAGEGHIYITGGEFQGVDPGTSAPGTAVLNVQDVVGKGWIHISGGRFLHRDPSKGDSNKGVFGEGPENSFVDAGFDVVTDGDWYEVVKSGARARRK